MCICSISCLVSQSWQFCKKHGLHQIFYRYIAKKISILITLKPNRFFRLLLFTVKSIVDMSLLKNELTHLLAEILKYVRIKQHVTPYSPLIQFHTNSECKRMWITSSIKVVFVREQIYFMGFLRIVFLLTLYIFPCLNTMIVFVHLDMNEGSVLLISTAMLTLLST